MEVETSEGPGVVQEIIGGTLEVKLADGRVIDEQMNTIRQRMESAKEAPHQEETNTGSDQLEEATEGNLDQIIFKIKSNLGSSSALEIELKMDALQQLKNAEEFINQENWEDALMSLEDIADTIEEANPTEYEEVYAKYFDSAIKQVEEYNEDLEEAKTAFVTGQGGDTTTISYNSDSELKKVAQNSDIRGVKTASGQKIKG